MDTNDLNKLKSQNQLHFFHQLALQYFILYLIYPEFTAGIITIPFEMYGVNCSTPVWESKALNLCWESRGMLIPRKIPLLLSFVFYCYLFIYLILGYFYLIYCLILFYIFILFYNKIEQRKLDFI